MTAFEIGMRRGQVVELLDGEGRIVVAVGGRARHLLPTGLPHHLADSLEALVEIGVAIDVAVQLRRKRSVRSACR
jgi:hypothetical protein